MWTIPFSRAALAAALCLQGAAPPAPTEPSTLPDSCLDLVLEARLAAHVTDLVALGPRMGGTRSGDRAARWLAERFEAHGLEVRTLEDPPVVAHEEHAWSLGAFVAGARGELELELGPVLPWGFSPSAEGQARLALAPEAGVALLTGSLPRRDDTRPALVLVDGATTPDGAWPRALEIRGHGRPAPWPVFGLSGPGGQRLRDELAAGRDVRVEYALQAETRTASPRTVEARLAPVEGAQPGFVLFCAHGDSDSGGPGANDNASGVAIVLEIAAAWSAAVREGLLPPPPRELRFAVWGEEIHSTESYLQRALEAGERLLAVLNFDQSGFGSGADRLYIEPDDLKANGELVLHFDAFLAEHAGDPRLPREWASVRSQGGTDSYVFSDDETLRAAGTPSVTVYASAWDRARELPRTPGMPGESWSERDLVAVDFDVNYHSAGDLPETTTEREPWNMAWAARAAWGTALRWLADSE